MALVEFVNFGAMLVMWLLLFRAAQIIGKNTWIAGALGALHA